MPLDITDWIARQKIEETQFPGDPKTSSRVSYTDLGGNLAARIIQEKFPDYLNISVNRKVTADSPGAGAVADYSPFSGKINPPKGGRATEWRNVDGKRSANDFWGDGTTTDEVIDTAFVMLHEITHARSPLSTSKLGAPSDQAVADLLKVAVASDKFPSQGTSGALDELVASLLPIRDMNARGIRPTSAGTTAGRAQQGYDQLMKEFSWLPNYLDVQSKPDQKAFSTSPKIVNQPPTFTEAISSRLKSLFSFDTKKSGE